ncbi:MAG: tRNA preQ1(34) S-adenosylmethionine ribosyltransferase-isomerase QueA [Alphaproteobacteria bacterium]
MRLADFDFDLPREFIAQRPVVPRDAARLLEVGGALNDLGMTDLPALLRPGDVLVVNDTKVMPSRLVGRRGAARVEVTLHKPDAEGAWRAFARPARRLRRGDRVDLAPGFWADVAEKCSNGEVILRFPASEEDLLERLRVHGRMPLPPYIHRAGGPDRRDDADYQTIFARHDGAVAAPTAGLHFTEPLLAALEARGVGWASVTLHVGAGTFLPVKSEDLRRHRLHPETGVMTAATADAINKARAAGGRIVAVGTTSLRLLESAARKDGRLRPFRGETALFILPGYRFRAVDLLLTNFHLPRSSLFMLVCAFAGTERMKDAYEHAKARGYRFYSYGDCSLLHPENRS